MQRITPFLWFNDNAEEAVNFYTSIFKNAKAGSMVRYDKNGAKVSGRPEGSVMTAQFELAGQQFIALNGGPVFEFTRAVSFFVLCETEDEIEEIWNRLSEENKKIFWPLQEYPWSEKYGWLTDKFGLSWQLILAHQPQKIKPFFMFDGVQLGKAKEAMGFYVSVFNNSHIDLVKYYGPENKESEGLVIHSVFTLAEQEFMAMDSGIPNNINFNESASFVVNCGTQDEVDYYWEKLSAVPQAEQCGWLKDKYGVSWQIVPTILSKLLSDKDSVKAQRVVEALLKMKKLESEELIKAYEQV